MGEGWIGLQEPQAPGKAEQSGPETVDTRSQPPGLSAQECPAQGSVGLESRPVSPS